MEDNSKLSVLILAQHLWPSSCVRPFSPSYWRMILCFEQFLHCLLFFLPFFLEVGIGSYCFRASGFFVFPSVRWSCLFGFCFSFEKTFVCDKKDISYIQKPWPKVIWQMLSSVRFFFSRFFSSCPFLYTCPSLLFPSPLALGLGTGHWASCLLLLLHLAFCLMLRSCFLSLFPPP